LSIIVFVADSFHSSAIPRNRIRLSGSIVLVLLLTLRLSVTMFICMRTGRWRRLANAIKADGTTSDCSTRHTESEVHHLPSAWIRRRTAVQRGVRGRRRSNEVDGEFWQRAVSHVEVPVEQHRGGGASNSVAVFHQQNRRRTLNKHATAHARRTPRSRKHLQSS